MAIEWEIKGTTTRSTYQGNHYKYTYVDNLYGVGTLELYQVDQWPIYISDIIKSKEHAERIIEAIEGD